MAYVSQERKARIAAKVKPVLAKYGVKGTLAVENHSTIVLNIKSSKLDFIGNYNRVVGERPGGFRNGNPVKEDMTVNPYWFQEHFDGKVLDFLTEVFAALKSDGWYDKSDIQTDYFDVAYYVNVNVGRWNKPYQLEA